MNTGKFVLDTHFSVSGLSGGIFPAGRRSLGSVVSVDLDMPCIASARDPLSLGRQIGEGTQQRDPSGQFSLPLRTGLLGYLQCLTTECAQHFGMIGT